MGNSQSGLSINQTLLKSISHSFNSQKKNHLRRHECGKSASGDVIIHLCVRRWLATEGGYWLGSMNDCDVNGGWRILLQFLFIPRHLLSSSSAPPVPIPPPLSQDRFNRMGGGGVYIGTTYMTSLQLTSGLRLRVNGPPPLNIMFNRWLIEKETILGFIYWNKHEINVYWPNYYPTHFL